MDFLSYDNLARAPAKATVRTGARCLALAGPATYQRRGRDEIHFRAGVTACRGPDLGDLHFRPGLRLRMGLEVRAQRPNNRTAALPRVAPCAYTGTGKPAT